jgi:hypothetical protein
MPRYYNAGQAAIVPEVFATHAVDEAHKQELLAHARKHHPITSPARDRMVIVDGKVHLKVPPMYCAVDVHGNTIQKTAEWIAGSVALGIPGYGFWIVHPGKSVDLDVSVPEKAVKDAAPHLLNETEYALIQQNAVASPDAPVKSKKSGTQPE